MTNNKFQQKQNNRPVTNEDKDHYFEAVDKIIDIIKVEFLNKSVIIGINFIKKVHQYQHESNSLGHKSPTFSALNTHTETRGHQQLVLFKL